MTKIDRDGKGKHGLPGEAGVTLMETMVTVAIAALILTLGMPGLVDFIRDTRRDSHVGELVVSLGYARSEAIKRGTSVTLCPSEDGRRCYPESNWKVGWIIFPDLNNNGVADTNETVLRRLGAVSDETSLHGGRSRLVYRSDGFSTGFTDTLRICDARGREHARSIVLSNTGRVRVKSDADRCP